MKFSPSWWNPIASPRPRLFLAILLIALLGMLTWVRSASAQTSLTPSAAGITSVVPAPEQSGAGEANLSLPDLQSEKFFNESWPLAGIRCS